MNWITIIAIGLAANLDNLGIGLAYGVKETKIPLFSNIIIAFFSLLVTYISVTMGQMLTHYLPTGTANFLGSILLCVIGLWVIIRSHMSSSSAIEERGDSNGDHIISSKEAIYLGIALSLNCWASGIGVGANQISAVWTAVSVGIFSFLTIVIGCRFGKVLSETILGKYSTVISGGILILIGLYEMFF